LNSLLDRYALPLGFGVVHFILGRAALSLAVPPGYSSPIWPAAAIVVLAFWRLGWRAVLPIGASAFLLGTRANELGDVQALLANFVIACGTLLQGAAGGAIARRLERLDPELSSPWVVGGYLGLLGPATCLINSAFSVSLLTLLGQIPPVDAGMNWFAWWTGDFVGVVLLFPACFLWLRSVKEGDRSRANRVAVWSVALVFLTVSVYLIVFDRHYTELQAELEGDAEEVTRRIESARFEHETLVQSIDAHLSAIPTISNKSFEEFTAALLTDFPAVQALEWVSRVPLEERASFEASTRARGIPKFEISARDEEGDLKPAPLGQENYFPVTYVSPRAGNEESVGFDLGSEKLRAAALHEAARSGQVVSTQPIVLVQERSGRENFSYLVVSPVMRASSAFEETEVLAGYACAVIRVEDVIGMALESFSLGRLTFSVRDPRQPETKMYLSAGSSTAGLDELSDRETAEQFYSSVCKGRTAPWEISYFLGAELYAISNWWSFWTIMSIGLSWVFLSTVFLTTLSAQPQLIQRVVDSRTEELKAVSDELKCFNQELESMVAERTEELAHRNEELNAFVRSTTHDLRSHMGNLQLAADVMQRELGSESPSTIVQRSIRVVSNAAVSMRDLLGALLGLSQVDNQSLEIELVALDDVVNEVFQLLATEIQFNRVGLECSPLPQVYGDRRLLSVLYQNLITNAMKFTSDAEHSRVRVSFATSEDGTETVLSVSDNGIGIPPEKRAEVFRPFVRHPERMKYSGSGIGLSTCERIVQRLGGRIWIEESSEGGAQFCFTLPLQSDEAIPTQDA